MFVFFQSRRFFALLILVGVLFYFKSRYERQVVQLHQSRQLLQNLVLHDLAYQIDILNVMLRIISEASAGQPAVISESDRLRAELLKLRESAKGHAKHETTATTAKAMNTTEFMPRLEALRIEIEAFVKKSSIDGDARVKLAVQQNRLRENIKALEARKKTADAMNEKFEASSRMPLFKLFAP